MESTRISLARVLELGVRVSWREATSIVHEAVAGTRAIEGAGPAIVTAESCLLTRGGNVVLAGTAAQARPAAVVQLLDDLLASCSYPGKWAGAVADGTALDMIEVLSQHTTPKRRRVEVASVAIRGLAAEADAARAVADAKAQGPSADFDDCIAAPTPAASPTDVPWPSVTALAPPSAIPTIPEQTVAQLGDAAFGNAEICGPDLDLEHLITAVEAAPTPAASPTDVPWPLVAALAPPSAIPAIPEQTVAQLGDATFGNAEICGPDLDHEDLTAVVEPAPTPAASPTDVPWPLVAALAPPSAIPAIPEQTVAQLGDAAFGNAEVCGPDLDLEQLIAAVEAAPTPAASPTDVPWPLVAALAPPSAIPAVSEQTVAQLGDAAFGDAEVDRPGLDHEDLITVVEPAPTPAASPTDVPWPLVAALAPPSAIPAISEQTVAQLGNSTFGNAEIREPGLTHEDLIAAVEAAREWTAPEDDMAALAIGTSPAQGTRPSVTLPPASFAMDLPSARPQDNAVWTAKYLRGGYPSQFDRVKRASPVALVCSVFAVAAGAILGLQLPETRRSAVEPSELAIQPPEINAPISLDGHTPLARPGPAFLPAVADPPSVPPLVARSTPRGSPRIEDRRAPFTRPQDSVVRSIPRPAGGPETPAKNTATVAESRSLSATSAAAALLAPDAANSAGAPPPAVDLSPVVASPSATAPSPAETFGFAATYVPVNAVARSADRELEARAIQNVLGRYRIAFNKLDAGAALAVWPTVNEKTLAKAFEGLESHDLSFQSCQIEIFSVLAEAACSGSARYVPKVGSRTSKAEARRWRFSLHKASSGWLIDSVDAR